MVTSACTPWRVLVTRRLPAASVRLLEEAKPSLELDMWEEESIMPPSELTARLSKGADAIICVLNDKITKEVLDVGGERLKMVSTVSVGYNHIDVVECHRRGILIGNTPDVLSETTADTVVGLTLAACRRFKEATASVVDATWGDWTILSYCGVDVHSSVVGIVGLGRIGAAVARRLRAFNCTILYSGRAENPEVAGPLDATFVPLDDLLTRSDIIIPLCPLNAETTGMFDADKFAKMKKSAVFINGARGELVNQDDLVEALNTGEIYAAGLDVTTPEPIAPDHPLTKCPTCFILPHIGSASEQTRTAMSSMAARNILAGQNGTPLLGQVRP